LISGNSNYLILKKISEVGRVIGYKSFEKWSRFAKDLENEEKRKKKIKIGKITTWKYKNKNNREYRRVRLRSGI